jgi:hypothetical protein
MFRKLNERVKRLTLMDVKLVKLAVFFATIVVVKLFPQLLEINYLILIVLMIACSAKPFYNFWMKKSA